jgi:hypothetical protein
MGIAGKFRLNVEMQAEDSGQNLEINNKPANKHKIEGLECCN